MGKSTLAATVSDRPVIGTDAYQDMPWGDIPAAMIRDVGHIPRFVIEGVMVARALRGPSVNGVRMPGLTVDAVVYLRAPKVERLPGQATMAKSIDTIFRQWRDVNRSVPVYEETA